MCYTIGYDDNNYVSEDKFWIWFERWNVVFCKVWMFDNFNGTEVEKGLYHIELVGNRCDSMNDNRCLLKFLNQKVRLRIILKWQF